MSRSVTVSVDDAIFGRKIVGWSLNSSKVTAQFFQDQIVFMMPGGRRVRIDFLDRVKPLGEFLINSEDEPHFVAIRPIVDVVGLKKPFNSRETFEGCDHDTRYIILFIKQDIDDFVQRVEALSDKYRNVMRHIQPDMISLFDPFHERAAPPSSEKRGRSETPKKTKTKRRHSELSSNSSDADGSGRKPRRKSTPLKKAVRSSSRSRKTQSILPAAVRRSPSPTKSRGSCDDSSDIEYRSSQRRRRRRDRSSSPERNSRDRHRRRRSGHHSESEELESFESRKRKSHRRRRQARRRSSDEDSDIDSRSVRKSSRRRSSKRRSRQAESESPDPRSKSPIRKRRESSRSGRDDSDETTDSESHVRVESDLRSSHTNRKLFSPGRNNKKKRSSATHRRHSEQRRRPVSKKVSSESSSASDTSSCEHNDSAADQPTIDSSSKARIRSLSSDLREIGLDNGARLESIAAENPGCKEPSESSPEHPSQTNAERSVNEDAGSSSVSGDESVQSCSDHSPSQSPSRIKPSNIKHTARKSSIPSFTPSSEDESESGTSKSIANPVQKSLEESAVEVDESVDSRTQRILRSGMTVYWFAPGRVVPRRKRLSGKIVQVFPYRKRIVSRKCLRLDSGEVLTVKDMVKINARSSSPPRLLSDFTLISDD